MVSSTAQNVCSMKNGSTIAVSFVGPCMLFNLHARIHMHDQRSEYSELAKRLDDFPVLTTNLLLGVFRKR